MGDEIREEDEWLYGESESGAAAENVSEEEALKLGNDLSEDTNTAAAVPNSKGADPDDDNEKSGDVEKKGTGDEETSNVFTTTHI